MMKFKNLQLTRFRILMTVFTAIFVIACSIRAERPPFKVYSTEDGLAHDSVNKIVRDSRGFLWFCTAEGLSRFDGSHFTNFTQDDGLPHRNINDFLETRDGTYLIATSLGLTVFNPNGKAYRWNLLQSNLEKTSDEPPMFQTFAPTGEKRQRKTILSLAQDRHGTIWVGSAFGLFRVEKIGDDWRFEEIEVEKGIEVGYHVLLPDSQGDLLIASDNGLYRSSLGGKIEKFDKFGAHSMIEDRDGKIWVGAGGDHIGLRVFERKNGNLKLFNNYTKKDGLSENTFLSAIQETSDGRIFIGIYNGLCEFLPEAKSDEPKFRVLDSEKVTALAEDSGRNLWLGTELKGAWKLPRHGFANFGEKDGILPTDDLRSIFTNKEGEIFIPTRPQKILHLTNGKFESVLPDGIKNRSWGWHFLDFESKDGEWWLATSDGLRRYPKVARFADLATTPPKHVYTKKDGLFANEVFNIFEDSRGDIWMTINGTISRWERKTERITTYTTADGLPEGNGAIAFAEDFHGVVWFGFYFGGLARFRNNRFELFTLKDGIPESQVSDLFIDKQGQLWIGSSGFGLFKADNTEAEKPVFKSISTLDGLSSNQIICLTEDSFGRIYAGTGRGINRLDADGSFRVFTQADGLPSNFITRCAADKNGFLWFVSGSTLVRFAPEIEQESTALPIFIDKLSVNGVAQKISAMGETNINLSDFSSDQRQIQIDFFAQTFSTGDTIRYQYRLDEQDWSKPTEQQTVNLNLPTGRHSFAVRAVRTDGVSSENPAIVSFKILSPIWARWWFILLSILLFGSLIVGFYRYRTNRLREVNVALQEAKSAEEALSKSRQERLTELEKVRNRIATDLHDDIGASLTQIAILSEVAQAQSKNGVSEPLTKISNVSNELVGTMSDIVWSINPAKDHLSDLVQRMRRFASDSFSAKGINFQFISPTPDDDIPIGTNIRREFFLVFKESINNIVKHSEAKRVEIEFGISENYLKLRISDDGKGFPVENTFENSLSSGEMGGNGILSIKKRAAEMNGELEIVSEIGKGATTLLKLPLKNKRYFGTCHPNG